MNTNKKMIAVRILLALIFMASLVACQTPAGRSFGNVIDDSTISTKVKTMLFDDEYLSGFSISVNTFEGEVTLTGAVNNQEMKDRASDISQSVRGVKSVNNLLKLK